VCSFKFWYLKVYLYTKWMITQTQCVCLSIFYSGRTIQYIDYQLLVNRPHTMFLVCFFHFQYCEEASITNLREYVFLPTADACIQALKYFNTKKQRRKNKLIYAEFIFWIYSNKNHTCWRASINRLRSHWRPVETIEQYILLISLILWTTYIRMILGLLLTEPVDINKWTQLNSPRRPAWPLFTSHFFS